MDDPSTKDGTSPTGPRSYNLTPHPSPAPAGSNGEGQPERRAGSFRRRALLVGGGAAIPFVTTIGSRSVFAGGPLPGLTKSMEMSLRMGGGSPGRVGSLIRGGDSVAVWQQKYPKLRADFAEESRAFPAAVSGSRYLTNPTVAAAFALPARRANGVNFVLAAADANLEDALHGRAVWEISVTHNGETARGRMGSQFFAEATAALLNAATYGEQVFGMNDALVVQYVNRAVVALQSKARSLSETAPATLGASEIILAELATHIDGGGGDLARGETYYLAQMNSRSVA